MVDIPTPNEAMNNCLRIVGERELWKLQEFEKKIVDFLNSRPHGGEFSAELGYTTSVVNAAVDKVKQAGWYARPAKEEFDPWGFYRTYIEISDVPFPLPKKSLWKRLFKKE